MIELLKPIFKGSLAPYGEGLICNDTPLPGTIHLAEWFDSENGVDALLSRQAHILGTSDLRPVASAWILKYTALLLPPVAAAATLLKHVFPVGTREVAVDLDNTGAPQAIVISHLGSVAIGQDTSSRYAPLIDAHLTPLITHFSAASKLPAKILWGNVARRLDAIMDQAMNMAPSEDLAADIETDRDYLLRQRVWPHGRRNPLFGRQKTALRELPDGQQTSILLHRQCCLQHLVPGKDYCGACPLSPRFRLPELESGPENFPSD